MHSLGIFGKWEEFQALQQFLPEAQGFLEKFSRAWIERWSISKRYSSQRMETRYIPAVQYTKENSAYWVLLCNLIQYRYWAIASMQYWYCLLQLILVIQRLFCMGRFWNPDFPLLPPRSQWKIAKSFRWWVQEVILLRSGYRVRKRRTSIRMKNYISSIPIPVRFLEHTEKIQDRESNEGQYVLFVPRKKRSKKSFDFFPDRIKLNDRHFLSYPIGLFVLSSWNVEPQWKYAHLTTDVLCLSSGWIRFLWWGSTQRRRCSTHLSQFEITLWGDVFATMAW